MKLAFALSLTFLLFLANAAENQSYVHHDPSELPSKVKSPMPRKPVEELPTNFTWSNVNGKSYLTVVRNHHIPNYCGGCYAFASTSTLSDRIKIARDAQWPDIVVSPQVVLSCTANRGCHGGNPMVVYQYIHDFGISDETCSPYRARGHENGAPCTDELKCSTCDDDGNCYVPESYPVYYVEEFGHIRGEQAMLNEIYHRGPIACSIDATAIEDYQGGVITTVSDKYHYDHVISIVGFGVENDIPYWYVRNSWGSFWGGQDGFFKVIRGVNSLGIEGSCSWAVPKDTWTDNVRNYTQSKKPETNFFDALMGSKAGCVKLDTTKYERFPSKTGAYPWSNLNVSDLPESLDWRNVSGINYASWTRIQNSPDYCASCWVEAATSALADRIMIARNSTFPSITLAIQAVINCQGGGDCSGGDPLGVYEFAYEHGIPEDSCQNYIGKNPDSFDCSAIQVCKNCDPPAPYRNGTDLQNCSAITNYSNWKVSDYGVLSGVEDMKKAIYTGGPIACGIQSTKQLELYTSGVFSQSLIADTVNHQVAVVGWDVDENGVEHWIARNSWGSYWGELGYFRIQMGSNNLGIEGSCIWAEPYLEEGGATVSETIFF